MILSKQIVKYIIHISDIHICKGRFDEYRIVFNNLKIFLEKCEKGTILIITGDILDTGSFTSDEEYKLLKKLFNMCNILPIIFILGNHDWHGQNIDDINILDSFIKKEYENKPIYLLHDGIHVYGNIAFGVSKFHSGNIHDITNKKYTNKYKIALYHGGIKKRELIKFKSYDYILLGDYHKHKILSKNAIQAGSLIQQNYKEFLLNHGVVKINLGSGKMDFFPIKNEYGFCTVRIYNGECRLPKSFPNKARIRYICDEKTSFRGFLRAREQVDKTNTIIIESKYPKISYYFPKESFGKLPEFGHTLNEQLEFFRIYIEEMKIPKHVTKIIMELHELVYNNINQCVPIRNIVDIIEVKFDGILCYGKDNCINFDKLKKNKTLLFRGDHGTGKSVIFDVITYCLFGKTNRRPSTNIIETYSDSALCSLEINITNLNTKHIQRYLIERELSRKNNANSSKIHLYRMDKKKKILVFNPNSPTYRSLVDSKIRELVGEYDNYVRTTFMLSNNNIDNDITFQGPIESIRSICSLLGLNIFESYNKYIFSFIADLKKNILETNSKISYVLENNPEAKNKENEGYFAYKKLKRVLVEFEEKLHAYELYREITHVNGIPFTFLREKIPTLEKNINKILGKCGFSKINIIINSNKDMDSDKGYEIFFDKDDHLPNRIVSGSTQEIISVQLAMRIVLNTLSPLPKSSMWIIDDELSKCNTDEFESIKKIITIMKKIYTHIIIVSHNSNVQELGDYIIDFGEGKFSYASNSEDRKIKRSGSKKNVYKKNNITKKRRRRKNNYKNAIKL